MPPASPFGYGAAPGQPAPNNNLVWAILSTVLCCLPLGIVAIIKSVDVNTKWAQGDYEGAQNSAKMAKNFALWGAIGGFVAIAAYLVFVVAVGASEWSTY